MTRYIFRIAIALILMLPGCGLAQAQTAASRHVLYKLDKNTLFERGCFAPCECPVWESTRVRGTFVLTHVAFDGLFDNYLVTDVHWLDVQANGSKLPIKGSGTYKVGGEFAVQQQLSLDLSVGADPVTHYDSGLVTGPSDFPRIDMTISINGGYCFDTVITVRSRPALEIGVSDTGLSWDLVPQTTGYDIVGGDLRMLRATGGNFTTSTTQCLAANTGATSVLFTTQPAPGEGFWFLARWVDGTAIDSYDEDDAGQMGSRDASIEASAAACP